MIAERHLYRAIELKPDEGLTLLKSSKRRKVNNFNSLQELLLSKTVFLKLP